MERTFDLILYGATGFTGRLVARYIAEAYGIRRSVRWAIAGRNRAKLEGVRQELRAFDPDADDLPILLASSDDPAALGARAGEGLVVISTVGPYARHGSALVAACVETRTHYCDLTGENPWIKAMIDRHHDDARDRKVRIVHCCGFDSIPSELGVWALQKQALARHGKPLSTITLYVERARSGLSGGTVASMLEMLAHAGDAATRRALGDPYAFLPAGAPRGPDGPDQRSAVFDEEVGRWTGPFVMAVINTRVVRRTNALLAFPWGTDFSYREVMSFGVGARGWATAQAVVWGLGLFMALGSFAPTRRLLEATVLPASGEGPAPEVVEGGRSGTGSWALVRMSRGGRCRWSASSRANAIRATARRLGC